jgi:thiol:disulfide interchange protein
MPEISQFFGIINVAMPCSLTSLTSDTRVWVGLAAVVVIGWLIRNAVQGPPQELVVWQSDPALVAGSRDPDRPLMLVEFTAPGCGACEQMARQVFTQPFVADAMKRFVAVRLDAYQHEALAERFGVTGVPAFLILGPDGKVLAGRVGFMPWETFRAFLEDAQAALATTQQKSAER